MQPTERKQYIRLIYKRGFQYLGAGLVIALLIGTLLGGGIYMVNAVCALGFVLICWGWFTYLKFTGMLFFQRRKNQKKKVPFMLRRFKEEKPHRPSFQMDASDFDDDLTSATVASEENFDEKQRDRAHAIARAAAGVLMVIFSFIIPIS